MTVIPIYEKNKQKKPLCSVTVLVDSQVSDRCPWATFFFFFFFFGGGGGGGGWGGGGVPWLGCKASKLESRAPGCEPQTGPIHDVPNSLP